MLLPGDHACQLPLLMEGIWPQPTKVKYLQGGFCRGLSTNLSTNKNACGLIGFLIVPCRYKHSAFSKPNSFTSWEYLHLVGSLPNHYTDMGHNNTVNLQKMANKSFCPTCYILGKALRWDMPQRIAMLSLLLLGLEVSLWFPFPQLYNQEPFNFRLLVCLSLCF